MPARKIIRSAYAYILVGATFPFASFAAEDPFLDSASISRLNGTVAPSGNSFSLTAQGRMGETGFDIMGTKQSYVQQLFKGSLNTGGSAPANGNFKVNGELPNPLGVSTVGQLVDKLSIALITIAVPVVTAMCLYGAFLIAKSGGNPSEIKKGQETIYYAALGFGLLLLAGGVTQIIQELFA